MFNGDKNLYYKFTYGLQRLEPFFPVKYEMQAWKSKKGPEVVLFHWTGGNDLSSAVNTLFSNGLSYHFIIQPNGEIVQCCPINMRAAHAGHSWGPRGNTYTNKGDLNYYSIGVSFVYTPQDNPNVMSEEQMTSAKELVIFLKENFSTIKWVTTHFEVTPDRKPDIYFWGNDFQGDIGRSLVHEVNSNNDNFPNNGGKISWWQCGNQWKDKNGDLQDFSYATTNRIGGFDTNGVREDGKWGPKSYTIKTRNENAIQYKKDFSQKATKGYLGLDTTAE